MEAAEKLSVTVTPAMARMIREKVEQGSYGSASEVIRAALRALERDEAEHKERLAAIKARIKASVEDTRPGYSLDEAFEFIERHIEKLEDDRSTSRPAA